MAFAATAGATIDTRLLGKPRVYNNDRKEWSGFKFILKNYVGALSATMGTKMENAEKSQLPLMLQDFGQDL